jgi:similar to stage IV sporulation protein
MADAARTGRQTRHGTARPAEANQPARLVQPLEEGEPDAVLVRAFWAYVTGFLVLVIRGEHPERMINLSLMRGVVLWDVVWVDRQTLTVKVTGRSFRPLRHIARRTRCRIRIRDKHGLPFILHRLRRRWMLVGGTVIFCLILFFLSSLIWTVEITGTKQLSDAQVRRAAVDAGLCPGHLRWLVNAKEASDILMRELPGVAFAEVSFHGTRATIRIYEKVLPPPPLGPCNIVAGKDGVVSEIMVLAGSPQVKEGDVVHTGQLLISGVIAAPAPPPAAAGAPPPPRSEPLYVQAQGMVRAQIWYRGYAEAPREELVEQKTGNVTTIVSIRMANKEIIIKGPPSIPYALYSLTETKRSLPQWRNINVPVELVTVRAEEMRRWMLRRSYDQAVQLAVLQAQESLAGQIPARAAVIQRRLRVVVADEKHVGVQLTIETLEEIGAPQQFAPPAPGAGPR